MTKQLLEWSDNYLVGIEELDTEHRDLINRLNELHERLYRRQGDSTRIENNLREIHDRIQHHFDMEESLMRNEDYPDYVQHKKEHDAFLHRVDNIITKYRTNPTYGFKDVLEDILQHWIRNHITSSDHELATYIKGGR